MPLIITHGWPSTFFELLKIIPLLTDPASHGGDVYSKDELLTNITIYWATQTISSSVRIYYEALRRNPWVLEQRERVEVPCAIATVPQRSLPSSKGVGCALP